MAIPENLNAEPIKVKHSVLQRFSDDSAYKSICPVCKKGLLLVIRDSNTLKIMEKDRCILCGQMVIYEDVLTMPQ